jgi:hypothetical protein
MRSEPLIFVHLKLVAKISLAVGSVAVLSLLGALTILGPSGADSYAAMVRSNALTAEHLGTIMLLTGLVLVAITGVVTWLIALYSSFRIAGPLYRLSQNLKLASAGNSAPLIKLRRGDTMNHQARRIEDSVEKLRMHYAAVEQLAQDAHAALDRGDADAYADAAAHLKALDDKVRF